MQGAVEGVGSHLLDIRAPRSSTRSRLVHADSSRPFVITDSGMLSSKVIDVRPLGDQSHVDDGYAELLHENRKNVVHPRG